MADETTAEQSSSTRVPPQLTPWKPGQSGNPRGRRPLVETFAELVRKLGSEEGKQDGRRYIDQLVYVATQPHRDTKARIQALTILIERGWGKAPQDLNINAQVATLDAASLARLSDAELQLAAALARKMAGLEAEAQQEEDDAGSE